MSQETKQKPKELSQREKQFLREFDLDQYVSMAAYRIFNNKDSEAAAKSAFNAIKNGLMIALDNGPTTEAFVLNRECRLTDSGREAVGLPRVNRIEKPKPTKQQSLFEEDA